jgi:hypothetical protein
MIKFSSVQFIDVLSQQPEGQLQKQHTIYRYIQYTEVTLSTSIKVVKVQIHAFNGETYKIRY